MFKDGIWRDTQVLEIWLCVNKTISTRIYLDDLNLGPDMSPHFEMPISFSTTKPHPVANGQIQAYEF